MRAVRIFSVLMILALVLAGCGGAQQGATTGGSASGGDIKVAVLAPLSGSNATFGQSTAEEGALMAIDEWNANGGVLGKKIVASVEDGQCKPDPAVNAANKIIDQDKIHYIIGEVCSSASIPVSKIATAKKVVQISPTSTNDALTIGADGKAVPYIFRACYNDSFQGQVIANFAKSLNLDTAFIMVDQSNPYTVGLANSFEKQFTANGGQVLGKENYTGNDTDFSAVLAKVAAANPKMVFLGDYYPTVNLMYKQAKEKGITAPFMGGDGWDSSDLDRAAADGGYYSNHYDPGDPRPEVQNFIKAYGEKYKDDKGNPKVPDALATLAYDATQMLLNSIKNAGADDTDKVQEALLKLQLNGVSGKISIDPNTHNPVKAAVIEQVKDGKINYVTTVNP